VSLPCDGERERSLEERIRCIFRTTYVGVASTLHPRLVGLLRLPRLPARSHSRPTLQCLCWRNTGPLPKCGEGSFQSSRSHTIISIPNRYDVTLAVCCAGAALCGNWTTVTVKLTSSELVVVNYTRPGEWELRDLLKSAHLELSHARSRHPRVLQLQQEDNT
jgi:hypothetical protein